MIVLKKCLEVVAERLTSKRETLEGKYNLSSPRRNQRTIGAITVGLVENNILRKYCA